VSPVAGRQPYVGPRPYGFEDRRVFFGRAAEARAVAKAWSDNRLLVLHGPSGVGKSSLLHAGVIPLLDRSNAVVLPVGDFTQVSTVPTALPSHNPYTFALLSSWAPDDSPARLSGISVADYLFRVNGIVARRGRSAQVLAAIDRFEELLRSGPALARHREQFIAQLAEAMRMAPHLRLVIAVREDWLEALSPLESLLAHDQPRARFGLEPLRQEEAVEAVLGPAAAVAVRSFEDGAAEHLVTNLRAIRASRVEEAASTELARTVEPVVLQILLADLWNELPDETTVITSARLPDPQNVDRILAEFCDRVIGEVAATSGTPEVDLREWLARTFITELGTRNTAYEGSTHTAGMNNTIAHAFEDRYLLRAEWRGTTRWYQLAHDCWIRPVQAVGRIPGHPTAAGGARERLRSAEVAFRQGESLLARIQAQGALRLSEGDPRVAAESHSILGDLAFQDGRVPEALDHYRRAAGLYELVQDTPAVGLLLAAIGRLLLQSDHAIEAAGDLQRAAVRLPGNRMVRIELARALRHSGQLRGAAGVYGVVLGFDPEETSALAERAQVNAELGDSAAALEDLDHLARLNPQLASGGGARSARAIALAQIGRIEKATVEAAAAVAEEPDSGPVLARAASVSAQAGERHQAIELVSRALAARHPGLLPDQALAARSLFASLSGNAAT